VCVFVCVYVCMYVCVYVCMLSLRENAIGWFECKYISTALSPPQFYWPKKANRITPPKPSIAPLCEEVQTMQAQESITGRVTTALSLLPIPYSVARRRSSCTSVKILFCANPA